MHPIMPFVTEKIWLTMPHDGKSLVTAAYPVEHSEFDNPEAEKQMDNLIELIKAAALQLMRRCRAQSTF